MANETARRDAPPRAVDLEKVRAEFGAAVKNGAQPQIDECLKDLSGESKEQLLRDLLAIEFSARRERGEVISATDYLQRFAEHGGLVQRVYDQCAKPRQLKGYEQLQYVACGGMGVVYKARQVGLNRTVAIKFLPERSLGNERMLARFQQEMQAIGQLSHENIVQAYDAGEDGGQPFLVMEFVAGVCVSELVKSRGPLSLAEACEIGRQVSMGLEYARKKEVVHRDIKPSNLIVTPEGLVKILDFGLARVKLDRDPGGGLTGDRNAMGTLDYMAPEQFEDAKHVDHRADIYSLGCTLFHLLAGRAPFGMPKYSSELAKKKAHTLDPTPRIDDERQDVPSEVAAIIERMMAKHRTERYVTAGEVAADLVPFAAGANLVNYFDPDKTRDGIPCDSATSTLPTAGQITSKQSKAPRGRVGDRSQFGNVVARLKQRPWLAAAVALLFVVSSSYVLIESLHRSNSIDRTTQPKTGGSSGVPKNRTESPPGANSIPLDFKVPPSVSPPRAKISLGPAIATLPGLNGDWWFDEMPWLIPESRDHLARWADDHATAGSPTEDPQAAELRTALLDALNSSKIDGLTMAPQIAKELEKFAADALPGENDFGSDIASELKSPPQAVKDQIDQLNKIEGMQLAGKPVTAQTAEVEAALAKLTAGQCHLLAVVWHKKALVLPTNGAITRASRSAPSRGNPSDGALSQRQQLIDRSEIAYQTAIHKYSDLHDDLHVNRQLRALCQCDLAMLYRNIGGNDNLKSARKYFERAVGRSFSISPFAKVYALVHLADVCAQLEDKDAAQAALDEADAIAASQLPTDHPLQAVVKEYEGWKNMDFRESEAAEKNFAEAWKLRARIGQGESRWAMHDKHGQALAEQFEAIFANPDATPENRKECLARSHADFHEVIDKLTKFLDKRSLTYQQLSSQALLDWSERMRNSLDRDADGYLYGDRDYEKAAAGYEKCLNFVQDNSEEFPASPDLAATRCKLAIALASEPAPDLAKLQASLLAADQYAQTALCPPQKEAIEIVRATADILGQWQQTKDKNTVEERNRALVDKLGTLFEKKVSQQQNGERVQLLRDERLAYYQLLWVVSGGDATREKELRAQIHDAAHKAVEAASPSPK